MAKGQDHREQRHTEIGGEPLPRSLRQRERQHHGKRGPQHTGIAGHPTPAHDHGAPDTSTAVPTHTLSPACFRSASLP